MRRWGGSDGEVSSLDPAVCFEVLDDRLDFLDVLDTVPEQAFASTSEASISPLEMPGSVLIIDAGGPEETTVVLLDGVEDIIDDVVENSVP